jgi:hypothetical protein
VGFFRRPFRVIPSRGGFLPVGGGGRRPIGVSMVTGHCPRVLVAVVVTVAVAAVTVTVLQLVLLQQTMATEQHVTELEHFQLMGIGQMGTGQDVVGLVTTMRRRGRGLQQATNEHER